jgi:regulator of protease activity HflC (stomatin/prohibitin superfamily)
VPVLWIVVVALVVLFVALSVRTIHQATVGIVERLGRFHRTAPAGVTLLIPLVDRMRAIVDMRERFIAIRPQSIITKDNVTIQVDSVLYFQVVDPVKVTYNVANFEGAVEMIVQTALRAIIGGMTLNESLSERQRINALIAEQLDREIEAWGVKVHRIEIRDIVPPQDIRDAMEKQMRAERERIAVVTTADGEKQAAILRAEGLKQATILEAEARKQAAILEAEGQAQALLTTQRAQADAIAMINAARPEPGVLSLRAMEALGRLAEGKATTLVVPSDLAAFVAALAQLGLARVPEAEPRRPTRP